MDNGHKKEGITCLAEFRSGIEVAAMVLALVLIVPGLASCGNDDVDAAYRLGVASGGCY